MFRPLDRQARLVSLTRRACWQGCQSAAALWAIGKQRESCRISRSADGACTTGQVCKALCCGDREAGSESLAVASLAHPGAANWRVSGYRQAGRNRAASMLIFEKLERWLRGVAPVSSVLPFANQGHPPTANSLLLRAYPTADATGRAVNRFPQARWRTSILLVSRACFCCDCRCLRETNERTTLKQSASFGCCHSRNGKFRLKRQRLKARPIRACLKAFF
jgi:hypothetical protein